VSKRQAASIITAAILLAYSAPAQSAEPPAPARSTDQAPGVRTDSVGVGRTSEPGRILVQQRCAHCHSIAKEGASPYPGAQPFRNLGARWTREKLTQALHTGILAEHDSSGVRFEMRMNDQEIGDFFDYLDSIATPDNPAPPRR
jgi:cytochrome c